MPKNLNLVKEWQSAHRAYRGFIYFGAVIAVLLVIIVILLRNIYSSPTEALFSEAVDSIIFETVLILAGAFLGSATLGFVFERYQKNFVEAGSDISKRFFEDGIVAVYESTHDPQLIQFVSAEIKSAKQEFYAIGMGLGHLVHNEMLLSDLALNLNKNDSFSVQILLGSADNQGVKARVEDEKKAHEVMNHAYDPSWVDRYKNEIESKINALVSDEAKARLKVASINTCPMVQVIKIDNLYFFSPYGTPNIRGPQSPWIVVEDIDTAKIASFLSKIIKYSGGLT